MKQTNALLVVLVTFLLSHWLRFGYVSLPEGYLVALLLSLFLCAVIFPATGAFRSEFEWAFMRRMRRLLAGWIIVIVVLVSLAAMLKVTDYYSRIWFGTWVLTGGFGLILVFVVAHGVALKRLEKGRSGNDIVLVGAGGTAHRVEEQIRSHPRTGMNLAACFGKPWAESEVQPIENLARYIRDHGIREVWIAVPWDEKDLLEKSLSELKESVVDVNVVPDLEQYRLLNQSMSEWNGLPVISLSGTPMTDAERQLKAVMDWLGAFFLCVLLSPLLLVIGLLILISDGRPVLFRQKRHGFGGESIDIMKFRTMKSGTGNDQFRQAEQGDQRVIPAVRWLRRTSLDELPQLFNVLKGEMSLVGPRPHPVELNEDFKSRIPKYMLRHKVKPGITGWAQVNGYRGETDTEEKMADRIEHDLWYIQNWSLWLDLKILLMTPFVMIHDNAY